MHRLGCSLGFFSFLRRKLRNARKQGIHSRAHLGFVRPLPVEALLQYVHRLETEIHDGGRRLDLAVAQPPDQVLDAMRDCPETLQPHLRRRPFHRMDRPEKLIDFFWIACSFKRKEAIADDLEMLFGFRLEEFQNLAGHFVVHWQAVEVRPRHRGLRRLRFGKLSGWLEFRLFVVQPRWLR